MAQRKLKPFKADDAGDIFTPTVKTIQGAKIKDEITRKKVKAKAEKNGKRQVASGKRKETKVKKKAKVEVQKKVEKKGDWKETNGKREKEEVGANAKVEVIKTTEVEAKAEVKKDIGSDVKVPAVVPMDNPKADKSKTIENEPALVKGTDDKTGDKVVQLVGFYLDNEEFGIHIQQVQEINRMSEVTPVPRTPDFVNGVINLRGKVIPVIQLRKRFGLDEKENDGDTRVIVVEVNGKTIGLVVDSVTEVLRIPANTIEPPPDIISGVDSEYMNGVGKLKDRLLILLNLEKVVASDSMDFAEKAA